MRLSKLSYLTLWAVHFDEVKKLYKDTLGLPVAQENENFVMFDTKGARLALHRLTKAPPLSRSTVEVHLEVNDVDEVYSSLRSKGVRFDEPPANRPSWWWNLSSSSLTCLVIAPLIRTCVPFVFIMPSTFDFRNWVASLARSRNSFNSTVSTIFGMLNRHGGLGAIRLKHVLNA